ncbi:hypothetical protein ABZ477_14290 [Microbacterium sp. NPDC019599]|uniref:hypothetical protein n=1 Tax=Microbacterium sp. NPDC019599 TaxID=3154690 RepID=UPI0033FA1E43
MKRIDIYYGGEHYSVGGRRLDDLQREIESGLRAGVHWLEVNDGEGMRRPALLMLTPGVELAVVPIPDNEAEIVGDSWDPAGATESYV